MDFPQLLREGVLDSVKEDSPEIKARILNIMEAIIEGMSVNEVVEAIGNGTLPKRYAPITSNQSLEPTQK